MYILISWMECDWSELIRPAKVDWMPRKSQLWLINNTKCYNMVILTI